MFLFGENKMAAGWNNDTQREHKNTETWQRTIDQNRKL